MLSASHFAGSANSSLRIIVYTDNPAVVQDLPVQVELNNKILADWLGPSDYIHRRKILAAKDALKKQGGRTILCDSDTFFLKNPKKAFARVGPGRTMMHLAEYHLYDTCAAKFANFVQHQRLDDLAGRAGNITPST